LLQTSKGRKTRWRRRIGPMASDSRRSRRDSLRGVAAMMQLSSDQRIRMGPVGRKVTATCGPKNRLMGVVMVTTRTIRLMGVGMVTTRTVAAARREAVAIAAARLFTAEAEGEEEMEAGGGGRHHAAAAVAAHGGEAGSAVIVKTSGAVARRVSAMAAHVEGSKATVPMGLTVALVIGPGLLMMLQWAAPGPGAALQEKTVVMAFVDHAVAIHVQLTEGIVASVLITEVAVVTEMT